jgi:adenosine deaminase
MKIIQRLLFILLSGVSPLSFATIDNYFATIKSDPNALYAFFKEMPKGGELHYHLAGGAYPETMLALASHGDYCLNPETQGISKTTHCDGIKTATLATTPELYRQVIRAWSMKDFIAGHESSQEHFFASFVKFIPIVIDFRPQLLAEIIKRASNQHELYLEIMVLPDNANSSTFAPLASGPLGFAAKQHILLTNKTYQKNITHTISEAKRILQQARIELGCDALPLQAVCAVTVKFQYYILREQPLDNLFAQALNGFVAASQSTDIVGVNLVQEEDGIIALRDYQEQMRIFKFLHTVYPKVHISLHAGELAPQNVPPAELRFHIHDAIFTGQAQRIGHGVDIAYEDNAKNLLKYMAKTPVPVEINLTSNREILNISGLTHPLRYYLAHQVPVVLSTDDEGILRTDLSREYVEAVMHHGLDYRAIKTINNNALTYSFLPGKNLWLDPGKHIAVEECQNMNSTMCMQFIKDNEKARLQWQLEKKIMGFERRYTH